MSESIVVRPARPEDGEALLSLIDALADYEELARPVEAARTRLLADIFERNPPRLYALLAFDAEDDTRPLGYALYLETYSSFLALPTLYIEDLFVLPEARKRGAGSALFTALEKAAIDRDCGRLEWVCLNWNQLAIDFYAKRDAEHLTEWRTYRLQREQLLKRHDKSS